MARNGVSLNVTLTDEQIKKMTDDIKKRVKIDVGEILNEVTTRLSIYFGTYGVDETVKITDVFEAMEHIKNATMEETENANET